MPAPVRPPSPGELRIPSPGEARIIAQVDGRSLKALEVVSATGLNAGGIYEILRRMVTREFIMRVGNRYRATVYGRAALKRFEAIEALKAEPMVMP
jgi:DNA-binding IclR family transcriptional regulator